METHTISNKHLYNDSDVKLLQQALAHFFVSGDFINPFCADNTSGQQDNNQENMNCNRHMNKKLISLTESDLHRIVRDSVSLILKENNYSNPTSTQQVQQQNQQQQVQQQSQQNHQQMQQNQQQQMTEYQKALMRWCNDFAKTYGERYAKTKRTLSYLIELTNDVRERLAKFYRGY